MYGHDGERDLNFAVSQARLLAAGARTPEDSRGRGRLLSAVLLILSAVAVGLAWLAGGTRLAIIAAVVCLAVLVGSSLAIGLRAEIGPRESDPAVPPDWES